LIDIAIQRRKRRGAGGTPLLGNYPGKYGTYPGRKNFSEDFFRDHTKLILRGKKGRF